MGKKRFRGFKKLFQFKKWLSTFTAISVRVVPYLGVTAAAVGLFLAVRTGVYADSGLFVRQLIVDPREMAGEATVYKINKQILGKNIFEINLEKIESQLEKNPAIQNVRVERQFPDTIHIQIDSRKPAALVQLSPGARYGLVTQDAMIIDVFNGPKEPYVVIESFQGKNREPRIGSRVTDKGFLEALHFLEAYWQHAMSFQEPLDQLMLDRFGNISLRLIEGSEIRLGRKPMEKLEFLDKIVQLLNQQDRRQIEYVDLQFDTMIVKRRG